MRWQKPTPRLSFRPNWSPTRHMGRCGSVHPVGSIKVVRFVITLNQPDSFAPPELLHRGVALADLRDA